MSAQGFLSKADLRTLTGRAQIGGQEAWLKAEGIPCRRNGKDELVVSWAHANAWLEGRQTVSSSGPNWAALHA